MKINRSGSYMKYLKVMIVLFLLSMFSGCTSSHSKLPVKMSFLACGDADIAVIQNGEDTILIDTGESSCSETVIDYLNKNIKKIDFIILTHPDKDHIGNATLIMKHWKPKKVYASEKRKKSQLEKELLDYVATNNIHYEVVTENKNVNIGSLEIEIEPPIQSFDDFNNSSLITYIKVGNMNTFFGADIKKKRIEAIQPKKSVIVKLPYHGRYISNMESLLQQLQPELVIIPSKDPDPKTISLLEKLQIDFVPTTENIYLEMDNTSWNLVKK